MLIINTFCFPFFVPSVGSLFRSIWTIYSASSYSVLQHNSLNAYDEMYLLLILTSCNKFLFLTPITLKVTFNLKPLLPTNVYVNVESSTGFFFFVFFLLRLLFSSSFFSLLLLLLVSSVTLLLTSTTRCLYHRSTSHYVGNILYLCCWLSPATYVLTRRSHAAGQPRRVTMPAAHAPLTPDPNLLCHLTGGKKDGVSKLWAPWMKPNEWTIKRSASTSR